MRIPALFAVAAVAVTLPHAPSTLPPPTAKIVAGALQNALAHHEQTAGTHYRFYGALCQTEAKGKRWVCTIRAKAAPGHLILYPVVTYKPHVGFDFGAASLL